MVQSEYWRRIKFFGLCSCVLTALSCTSALANEISEKDKNCKRINERQALIPMMSSYFLSVSPEIEAIIDACRAQAPFRGGAPKKELDQYYKSCIRKECDLFYKKPEKLRKNCVSGRELDCYYQNPDAQMKDPKSCADSGESIVSMTLESLELELQSKKLSCDGK